MFVPYQIESWFINHKDIFLGYLNIEQGVVDNMAMAIFFIFNLWGLLIDDFYFFVNYDDILYVYVIHLLDLMVCLDLWTYLKAVNMFNYCRRYNSINRHYYTFNEYYHWC